MVTGRRHGDKGSKEEIARRLNKTREAIKVLLRKLKATLLINTETLLS